MPGASSERIASSTAGLTLALHAWVPHRPRAALFYVHGIQSHAGWLFETGPKLADAGVALYVADRRGAGASDGPRGDTPSFHAWIDDGVGALELVRARHPKLPLTLFGQSMGGSVAVAIAGDPRARYDALILCAPALGQRRARMTESAKHSLREEPSLDASSKVPIEDGWYTSDPRYLEFLAGDRAMLRVITKRSALALLELEEHYFSLPRPLTRRPAALILPRNDRIIRLPIARRAFAELLEERGLVIELPTDDHYLEFSPCRDAYLRLLVELAASACFSTDGR